MKGASETSGRLPLKAQIPPVQRAVEIKRCRSAIPRTREWAKARKPLTFGMGKRLLPKGFLRWIALGWTLGLAACGSSLPCKPTVTDHSQPCDPGDWEWAAWGSCCRVECGADGRWHSGKDCVFVWCGPIGSVEFDLGSASIRKQMAGTAARLSRMGGSYSVVGYVDVLESKETPGLDLRRAEAFRSALIDAGVCGERLVAVGGGVLQLPDQGNRRRWGGIARLVLRRTPVAADASTGFDGGGKSDSGLK